ncbi:uncharacterized protein LOC111388556 [Olea europaea var. sylvestris]|uniref:uncharacterized protein LOC111388556 n=1 Tax=Olea europaea var. sylvestris TaxID=158386 RepID=UPI000C1D6B5F|nr:uncharacterized protein LOC111388556 [Olea europaea var. sylvestris]
MGPLIFNNPIMINPIFRKTSKFKIGEIGTPFLKFQFSCFQQCQGRFAAIPTRFAYSSPQRNGSENPQNSLQDLRVPNHWCDPSKASEESEWLRVTLHKWLDDEYCPEPTNVEISNIAATTYYKSLVEKQTDLGEILLKMAVELESISYQESFHGAFSSANAAVNLIIQRIALE